MFNRSPAEVEWRKVSPRNTRNEFCCKCWVFSDLLWIRCKIQAYSHLKNENIGQSPCLQVLLASTVTQSSLTSVLQQNSQGTDAAASCVCREGEIYPQAEGSGYHTSFNPSKDTPADTQRLRMNCKPRQQCINNKSWSTSFVPPKEPQNPTRSRSSFHSWQGGAVRIRTWWQIWILMKNCQRPIRLPKYSRQAFT